MKIQPPDIAQFEELADQWEKETALLSNSSRAAEHPACQEIIGMGQPAVPRILERMEPSGGHWFQALHRITGENPVDPKDHGDVAAMQKSWLDWGRHIGAL